MIATLINCALVLAGSAMGLIFRSRISARFSALVTQALGLCVLGIGIASTLKTDDALCVIICMVVGSVLGEALRIEQRLDSLGDFIKNRLPNKGGGPGSRFTEGFVSASVLYCVGAMAITGAMDAGLRQDYSVLISKGVIDGVTAITFAAAMGVGVAFSVLPMLFYQGGLTLLAQAAQPLLAPAVVAAMSAVGGTIIVGIAINMLGLGKERIRVGNLLPSIFLPLVYLPLAALFS